MTTSIPRLSQSTSLHMYPSSADIGISTNGLHPTEPASKGNIGYYVETDNRHISSSEGPNSGAHYKPPITKIDHRPENGKIIFKIF